MKGGRAIGKSYKPREVIKLLKKDGWYIVSIEGSHHHFKHPTKQGKVTVAVHNRDIPKGTLKQIEKQSGLRFP